METTFFLKSLSLFHCVPLYVCRLCINFQDLCARLLGMAALRILLLTFISRFVIDFLSIMHLSIACPTTPLTGLGGAIARRLQQICPSIRPQHRGL